MDYQALATDLITRTHRAVEQVAGLRKADVPIVGVIPGDGWRAEVKTETGDTDSRPILAWTLDAEGTCTPLVADSDGYTEDATGGENFIRVYQPGEMP